MRFLYYKSARIVCHAIRMSQREMEIAVII